MGRATRIGVSPALDQGVTIDVTTHEAVAVDAELEAEIAMGAPVGEDGPTAQNPAPFQGHMPPEVSRKIAEGESDRLTRLRDKYPLKPGAPVPYGLRTPEERQRLRAMKDESKPPMLAPYQPPIPMTAPSGPAPRGLDELLKLALKASIDEEDEETRDMLIEVQKDRKKRFAAPPGPGPGFERREG
jgi:hypothetical protein